MFLFLFSPLTIRPVEGKQPLSHYPCLYKVHWLLYLPYNLTFKKLCILPPHNVFMCTVWFSQ
jgi:hypothetical protein